MSVYSGFFNGVNHDRLYDAVDFSKVFDGLITDGVYIKFPSEAESTNRGFYVAATGSGRTVSVAQGRAWLKGTWTLNDGTISFTLDGTANELQSRIDAIVIDVNIGDDARVNDIKVIKGTEGTTPDRPTLINQPTHRQYPIAYITVPGGASTIVQSNIQYMVGTSALPAVKAIVDLESDAIDELNGRIDQINENVPFKFGVDSNGKYGYYKVGADTVTPFRNPTGSAQAGDVRVGKTFSNANNDNITGTMQPPVGDAVPSDVRAGKTFSSSYGVDFTGTLEVTSPTGNATSANVLSGKTFSSAQGTGLVGTMPNLSGMVYPVKEYTSNGNYTISVEKGYHDAESIYVSVNVDTSSSYNDGYIAGRNQGKRDAYGIVGEKYSGHTTWGGSGIVLSGLVSGRAYSLSGTVDRPSSTYIPQLSSGGTRLGNTTWSIVGSSYLSFSVLFKATSSTVTFGCPQAGGDLILIEIGTCY